MAQNDRVSIGPRPHRHPLSRSSSCLEHLTTSRTLTRMKLWLCATFRLEKEDREAHSAGPQKFMNLLPQFGIIVPGSSPAIATESYSDGSSIAEQVQRCYRLLSAEPTIISFDCHFRKSCLCCSTVNPHDAGGPFQDPTRAWDTP